MGCLIIATLFFSQLAVEPTADSRPPGQTFSATAAELYSQGNLDGAIAVLGDALEATPQDAQLHFMLANALFRKQHWPRAAAHYHRAAELRPDHVDTWLSLGHALLFDGQADQALEAWEVAIGLTPYDALPLLASAVGHLGQGDSERALELAKNAARLDSDWRFRLEIDIRWNSEMIASIEGLIASAGEPRKLSLEEVK